METVNMAVAIIQNDRHEILLREFDPANNPYKEPVGLFGGRLGNEEPTEQSMPEVLEMLNPALLERWNMTVTIKEQLPGTDEDVKADHDGRVRRFRYLKLLCELASGEPDPKNQNEKLFWRPKDKLADPQYYHQYNPPTARAFIQLGYLPVNYLSMLPEDTQT